MNGFGKEEAIRDVIMNVACIAFWRKCTILYVYMVRQNGVLWTKKCKILYLLLNYVSLIYFSLVFIHIISLRVGESKGGFQSRALKSPLYSPIRKLRVVRPKSWHSGLAQNFVLNVGYTYFSKKIFVGYSWKGAYILKFCTGFQSFLGIRTTKQRFDAGD